MTKYLVDSDVLMFYFKRKEPYTSFLESILGKIPVSISILSVAELRAGWDDKQASYYLPHLYTLFTLEEITKAIMEQAGAWRQQYKTKGVTLHTVDASIAATAFLNDYSLVTNNKKDFPIPELHIYTEGFGNE